MAGSKKLQVEIIGDASSLSRAFGKASKESGKFGAMMGRTAKLAGVGLVAMAGGAAAAGVKMISLASDAAEVQSKLEVVFGKQLPGLTKNIDSFSKATGASKFAMREQAADMGALLAPMLGSKKGAADMSLQFTKLATDLGSFNNIPVGDALEKIRAGLVGESEPLRSLGVLLTEATTKEFAYANGIAKRGAALTEVQKVEARAGQIMAQTALAQGDATRTAGSMANQMKELKSNVSDAATAIGMALIPYALQAVQAFNTHWPTIQRVAGQVFGAIAQFARTYWPQVKAAAQDVIVWYQTVLLPTLRTVLAAMQALWQKFGAETVALVRAQLLVLKSVVNTGLALIRGDWDAAWRGLVPTVRGTFAALVALLTLQQKVTSAAMAAIGRAAMDAIKDAFSGASAWLADAGRAIIQGLIDGLQSKLGEVRALAGSIGGMIKSLKGPIAKDRVLLVDEGKAIIQGLERGMTSQLGSLARSVSGVAPQIAGATGGGGGGGGGGAYYLVLPDGKVLAELVRKEGAIYARANG